MQSLKHFKIRIQPNRQANANQESHANEIKVHWANLMDRARIRVKMKTGKEIKTRTHQHKTRVLSIETESLLVSEYENKGLLNQTIMWLKIREPSEIFVTGLVEWSFKVTSNLWTGVSSLPHKKSWSTLNFYIFCFKSPSLCKNAICVYLSMSIKLSYLWHNE